jgi:hypothetical protein
LRRTLASEGVIAEDDPLDGEKLMASAPAQALFSMLTDASDGSMRQIRASAIIGAAAALQLHLPGSIPLRLTRTSAMS